MCLLFLKISSPHRKSGYSLRGFWGQINHFNKDGVKIGYTVKGFWGGRKRYDMNGNLVSYTLKNFWGGYNTYDSDGNIIRRSRKNFWGGYSTFNKQGEKIQESYRNFWNGMNHFDIENADTYATVTTVERTSYVKPAESSFTPLSAGKPHTSVAPAPKKEHVAKAQAAPTKKLEPPKPVAPSEHAGVEVVIHDKNGEFHGQHMDNSVEYYHSVAEYIQDNSVTDFVKLLVFRYGQLKEFPAIAYLQENMVRVEPLVKYVESFAFAVSEIERAKEVHVTDIDMGVLDNEFYTLSMSSLGKEFEDLLPEYPFGNDGIYRTQYVFDCGMCVTEKSMKHVRKLVK